MTSVWWQEATSRAAGTGGDGQAPGVWSSLPDKLDPMSRGLHPITEYEAVRTTIGGKEKWILKNPAAGTYVSLSPQELEIFKTLGPGVSMSEVCTKLVEKDIFPFFILGPCIQKLYANKFIANSNIVVLEAIRMRLLARTWRARVARLFNRDVHLAGLSRYFAAAYEHLFRWLFTTPAIILLHVIALAGVVGFFYFFFSGRYELLRFPRGLLRELPLLLLGQAVIIFLHEVGHGLTMTWSGREANRGGMSLTLLLPTAFFVSTNDMWLERRKSRRIAVSWAGPLVNLLGVAVCVGLLLVNDRPDTLLASVLYKTALISLFLFFLNVNPLQPTDGYYMLMDQLDVPSLSTRGTAFIRTKLWPKLKARESFSREERVLTVYGALVAVWGVVAAVLSVAFFWAFIRLLVELWGHGGVFLRGTLIVMGSLIAAPVGYQAFGFLEGVAHRVIMFLFARGVFFDLRKLAGLNLGLATALVLPPAMLHLAGLGWLGGVTFTLVYCAVLTIGASILAIWAVRRTLSHRFHHGVLVSLAVVLALTVADRLLQVVLQGVGAVGAMAWQGAVSGLVIGGVLVAASRWLSTVHHERRSRRDDVIHALAPVAAVLVAVPLVYLTRGQPAGLRAIYVLAGLLWSLGIAAWTEACTSLWESRFRLAFGILLGWLVLGLVALLGAAHGSIVFSAFVTALAAGFFLTAAIVLELEFARVTFVREGGTEDLLLPEGPMLAAAFAGFVERALGGVQQHFGKRKRERIVRGVNEHLVERAYGVFILHGKVLDQVPESTTLVERGKIYADAFGRLADELGTGCGRGFTDRLIENLHDSLYWAERELVTSYLFQGRRWDRVRLVAGTGARDPLALLRQVPLFYRFDDRQLGRTLNASQVRRFMPGETIIREGDLDQDLYVIGHGIVDVSIGGVKVNSLSDADYFGEVALIEDGPRTATVVARTATECYVLGRREFDTVVRPALGADFQMMGVIRRIGALRQFDLLRRTSAVTLAALLVQSEERHVRAGERIIRQGEVGDHFYIILDGAVRVVREESDGGQTVINERRRGEYFGEIALVRQIPRTASVYASTDCELLVISKDNFDAFFRETQLVQFSTDRVARIEGLEAGAHPAEPGPAADLAAARP